MIIHSRRNNQFLNNLFDTGEGRLGPMTTGTMYRFLKCVGICHEYYCIL